MESEVYTQYKYNRKPKGIIDQTIEVVRSVGDGALVLSAGSGDGYVERYIVEHTDARIICFDISPKGISIAKGRSLECIQGSVYEMPFKDGSFSLVVALHLFEHLTQPEIFLDEIRRVLRPEGKAFITLPNYGHLAYRVKYLLYGSLDTFLQIRLGHFRHFNYKEACRFLEENHYKVLEKRTFTFGHKLIGFLPKIHRNWFSFSTLLVAQPIRGSMEG